MFSRTNRNRIKIPNRVAGLAALLIVFGSIAQPEQLELTDHQDLLVEQGSSTVEESVTELVGVAASPPQPVNISSLIFRF